MTRGQFRFLTSCVGLLIGLVAACFASERLIAWWWAVPLLFFAGLLLPLGSERREIARRERNSR